MTMPLPPRGVEERLRWFLSHSPGGTGMCAAHSWRSLGGDYGNPPRWGCPDANCVHDKVKASGRYWTSEPPRGALVLWKYGNNGHAAISFGDGRIATTDPTGKPGGTGVEPLAYPRKWGAGTHIWTDTFNGVRFDVGSTVATWNVGQEKVIEVSSKTLKDGVYGEVGRIDIPKGGDYLLTLQGRLEAGAWARVGFARIGWGSDADGHDETGNDLWPPAPDGKATSHTHNHAIAGGGPVAFEVKPYGEGDTTTVTSIVVKALRVS